ncbi:MAG: NAD(P)-dependent oxidoreductase [Myxococcota bacterium]
MRVLVTGSSGFLGAALVRRLLRDGHHAVGLDPVAGPETIAVGSASDRSLVRAVLREEQIDAVVHAGALHKPQVATHAQDRFVDTNVLGTLVLLEEGRGAGVDRFVFTSTTSLLIDRGIRAGAAGGATAAAWLDEDHGPLRPRNIYGVTKLAAEHLCRLHHELHGLPLVILRTARFFPEEDDRAHRIPQSTVNTKVNELLFRRITLDDVVRSHVLALERAPSLRFDLFLITADTPFRPEDGPALIRDAPGVVERYHPRYRALFERVGWTMFDRIDRVYSPIRAAERLGFRASTTFDTALDWLEAGRDPAALF